MFSRRLLINFVLLILIILFTYIGNRYDVKTGFQSPPEVTEIDPNNVLSVALESGTETLLLQRDENSWLLEKPIRWPADNARVERLINAAQNRTGSQLSADEIDLTALGLDTPRATMRLDDTHILFGISNNIGARRYTLIDDTVYLLPDLLLPFVQQGLLGVIDRHLLPPRLRVRALKLPDFELTRSNTDQWATTPEVQFSQQQLAQLVLNWQQLAAVKVKSFDSNAIPRQKIIAELDNNQTIEFFLLSIEPELVIAHPRLRIQYHFTADFYYRLIALRADEAIS